MQHHSNRSFHTNFANLLLSFSRCFSILEVLYELRSVVVYILAPSDRVWKWLCFSSPHVPVSDAFESINRRSIKMKNIANRELVFSSQFIYGSVLLARRVRRVCVMWWLLCCCSLSSVVLLCVVCVWWRGGCCCGGAAASHLLLASSCTSCTHNSSSSGSNQQQQRATPRPRPCIC
jgi:hypothetical protein